VSRNFYDWKSEILCFGIGKKLNMNIKGVTAVWKCLQVQQIVQALCCWNKADNHCKMIYLFIYLGSTGVCSLGLVLSRKTSYHFKHTIKLLRLSYFSDRVFEFFVHDWLWTWFPCLWFKHIWHNWYVSPRPNFKNTFWWLVLNML
jgi:hypothetical protein